MGKPWFNPKRFGYGAGLPCSWEGWVVLAVYLVVIVAAGVTINEDNERLHQAIILFASLALIIICARTTRGGWRWRSGED